MNEDLFKDLLNYQKDRMNYIGPEIKTREYNYNIHDYIENDLPLNKRKELLEFKGCGLEQDYFKWAQQIIWFSRRTGGYKTIVTKLPPLLVQMQ